MMNEEAERRNFGKIIARAWADESFKKKLLSQPAATLRDEGMVLPAGMEVRVMENSDTTIHLVIPQKPAAGELTDEDLDDVSGGIGKGCKATH